MDAVRSKTHCESVLVKSSNQLDPGGASHRQPEAAGQEVEIMYFTKTLELSMLVEGERRTAGTGYVRVAHYISLHRYQ